jgi:FKBP-type peptidyl-prolyl cis-trans isomerase
MFTSNAVLTVRGLLVGFLISTLSALGQTKTEKAAQPSEDALIYETIGIMFAKGSGLGKMDFTDEQIKHILTGIKKGFSMKVMPPENGAVQEKVQAVMMQKMQVARQAEKAEMAKAAEGNKVKGQEYLALLSKQEGVLKDPSGFYY